MAEEFGRQTVPPFLRRAREALGADSAGTESDAPEPAAATSPAPPPGESAEPPRQGMSRPVAAAGERIQEILDAAENVAGEIRRDAEAEAREYLERRRAETDRVAGEQVERLESLLDGLRRELRAMERQGDAMVTAIESAIVEARKPLDVSSIESPETVDTKTSAEPAPEPNGAAQASTLNPEAPRVGPRPVAPVPVAAYEGTGQRGEPGGAGRADEAPLIRATQMAVQGSDRGEIEATLKREFGIDDASPILDEILGS